MKTKETETQLALAQIHYLLQGTQPTHSEADRAIRKALEITAHTLEKKRNMLEAQKVGLKTLNEFLRKSLPTPSAPCQGPPDVDPGRLNMAALGYFRLLFGLVAPQGGISGI